MATSAASIQSVASQTPEQEKGQEYTKSDIQGKQKSPLEVDLSKDDQQELIGLVRKLKMRWYLKRRAYMKRVLEAHEFFKGNHFISFNPDSFQWFDALESSFNASDNKSEDLNMYQFATNFVQMLGFAFVSAISEQMPEPVIMPENAENEKDIATAKASQIVIDIIRRKNGGAALLEFGTFCLWLSGSYFRHTRYVVDEYFAGTHKEPVVEMQDQEVMPSRYVCPQCGGINSSYQEQESPACLACGSSLSDNDYYPAEIAEMPVITRTIDVPNGMVKQDLYDALCVDVNPMATSLDQTELLSLEREVSVSALRTMFPEHWLDIRNNEGTLSAEGQQEKIARSLVYSEGSSRSQFVQDLMPTYSMNWIQWWAFNELDNKDTADRLRKQFPQGCLLCNIGDTFLAARKAKLTDEWTWAGTVDKKFGMYPPGAGDSAIPLQKRVNDTANFVHEHMDRLAGGIVLGSSDVINVKALNSTPMVPGRITAVPQPKAGPRLSLRDQIVQIETHLDAEIYGYTDKLVYWMQLLVGTPPQIFGGAGDPNVKTMGGQRQQLDTAKGKLFLFWKNIKKENAAADELAVKCAAQNMNRDWFNVLNDETREFKNEYVRIDEMQGSIKVYADEDRGMPMTAEDMRDFWMKVIEWASSGKNVFAEEILDEPTNQEEMAIAIGPPGVVVPQRTMRNKTLQIIDMMTADGQEPAMETDPDTGQQVELPTVLPEKGVDDFDISVATTKRWLQDNWRLADEKPKQYRNVLAYLKLARQYQKEEEIENAPPQMQKPGPQAPQTQGVAQ